MLKDCNEKNIRETFKQLLDLNVTRDEFFVSLEGALKAETDFSKWLDIHKYIMLYEFVTIYKISENYPYYKEQAYNLAIYTLKEVYDEFTSL